MKLKHLYLATAALLAAVGLWFAQSAWRTRAFHQTTTSVGLTTPPNPKSDLDSSDSFTRDSQTSSASGPNNRPQPGQMLRPPDPTRLFTDFTPEQRVEFARKGHGPGG